MDYLVEVENSVRRSQPTLYALVALFGALGLGPLRMVWLARGAG